MEKENSSASSTENKSTTNAANAEQLEQNATQTCLSEQQGDSSSSLAATTTPLSSSLSRVIMTSNQETDIIKKVAMSEEIPSSNSSLTISNTFTTSTTTTSCISSSTGTNTNTSSSFVASAPISATSTPTTTCSANATAIPQLYQANQSVENDATNNGSGASSLAANSNTATDADQFVTPEKSTFVMPNCSMQQHASTSLKKKRNKSSKCLQLNVSSSSCSSGNNTKHGTVAATHDAQSGNSSVGNIKTSLSMTSLPPNEKQDGNDKIKAKLNMERPYNSLKVSARVHFKLVNFNIFTKVACGRVIDVIQSELCRL